MIKTSLATLALGACFSFAALPVLAQEASSPSTDISSSQAVDCAPGTSSALSSAASELSAEPSTNCAPCGLVSSEVASGATSAESSEPVRTSDCPPQSPEGVSSSSSP